MSLHLRRVSITLTQHEETGGRDSAWCNFCSIDTNVRPVQPHDDDCLRRSIDDVILYARDNRYIANDAGLLS